MDNLLARDGETRLAELKNIEGGFKRNRGSVDLLWCVFFLAFIAAMVFTTYWSYNNGKVFKLVAPVDGDFRICGFDKGVEDYPNLYIAKMDSMNVGGIFSSAVCVKKCPGTITERLECAPTKKIGDCNSNALFKLRYPSKSIGKYCFPSNVNKLPSPMKESFEAAKSQLLKTRIGEGLSNVYHSGWAIVFSILTSILICILFIVLMSYLSEYFIYLSIGLFWLGNIAGIYLFFKFQNEQLKNIATLKNSTVNSTG
jgi:hypothetical protein